MIGVSMVVLEMDTKEQTVDVPTENNHPAFKKRFVPILK